jgi:hypothetical protein
MKAEGTLQTTFYTLIPFLLYYSKSRITNGKDVNKASEEKQTGAVYSLHITPFISIGLVNPLKQK